MEMAQGKDLPDRPFLKFKTLLEDCLIRYGRHPTKNKVRRHLREECRRLGILALISSPKNVVTPQRWLQVSNLHQPDGRINRQDINLGPNEKDVNHNCPYESVNANLPGFGRRLIS